MPEERKITVFVVDDEEMVRELLIGLVDWAALGMEVAGDSGSAMEALDRIEKAVPDIIFVDINMPFIDGLEFAAILAKRHPDVRIIILTGYPDFEYAQKSIKIGVSDYITKPISAVEITQSLQRIKQEILNQHQSRLEMDYLKASLLENKENEQNRLFCSLLYAKADISQLEQKLEYLGVQFAPDKFRIALIEIDADASASEEPGYRYLLYLYCADAVKSYLSKQENCHVFHDMTGKIAALFNTGENIIPICQRLKTHLCNIAKCAVNIGIGKPAGGLADVSLSYCQACDALKYKLVLGNNSVICFNELEILKKDSGVYDAGMEDFLFELKTGMERQAIQHLQNSFAKVRLSCGTDLNTLHIIAADLVLSILKACTETGIDMRQIFSEGKHPYEQVFKINTLPDMQSYLEQLVRQFIAELEDMRNSIQADTIDTIKKYIDDNICDYTLSLSGVADFFGMNPSYISRLFKEKTSCNFSKYLTTLRINKAIDILKNGKGKVYEIAEQVGIIDPQYFGVCFKKITGMSVSEYRDSMNSRET
jgi:two-component system response regulator YesN